MKKIGNMRAAPGDVWLNVGTNSESLVLTPPNNGDYRNFELRCIIRDTKTNITKTTPSYFVHCFNYPTPRNSSSVNSDDSLSLQVKMLEDVKPLEYLISNYPNPFNPTTTISYSIAEDCNTQIKIYDIIGREIETLVNSYHTKGQYKTTFNGSNLSSGIYFYRLITPKKIITQKMQIIK